MEDPDCHLVADADARSSRFYLKAGVTVLAAAGFVVKGPSLLRALDGKLSDLVNSCLQGFDPYSTLKRALQIAVTASGAARAWRIVRRDGLRPWVMSHVIPLVSRLPSVIQQLNTARADVRKDLQRELVKDLTEPRVLLPADGMAEEPLMSLMELRRGLDTKNWSDGKVTGAIYSGEQHHMDFIGRVYGMFAFYNPLHTALHPSLRQMDAEVVQMTINLYRGTASCCGAFTTGGTESILLAIKSYRDWARQKRGIVEPNLVVCVTAHAAFDKAAHYFGVHLRKCNTDAKQAADLRHMASLIDSNTIAIVGSGPQYATGTVDPIEAMSDLAISRGCGLHVDCCLGGFLVPFMREAGFELPHAVDFSVRGVTTISCDPHKYGFAPKGSSVLMFRHPELRHCMYSFATDWTGGIYATPTILGSRPGGVVAATWASMMKHGRHGYVETTRQIVRATRKIAVAIEHIEGIELVGRADVCVVGFGPAAASGLNIYSLVDCMKELGGWELATLQNPPAAHLALTLPTSQNADGFIEDLTRAVAVVRSDTSGKYSGGTAGIYGMAASLPAAFIAESVKVYLDTTLQATEGGSAA